MLKWKNITFYEQINLFLENKSTFDLSIRLKMVLNTNAINSAPCLKINHQDLFPQENSNLISH